MHAKKFNLKSEQVKAKGEGKGKQLPRAILEKGCPLKSERQTGLGLKKYLAAPLLCCATAQVSFVGCPQLEKPTKTFSH